MRSPVCLQISPTNPTAHTLSIQRSGLVHDPGDDHLKPLRRNISETTESESASNGSRALKLNPSSTVGKCLLITSLLCLSVCPFIFTQHCRINSHFKYRVIVYLGGLYFPLLLPAWTWNTLSILLFFSHNAYMLSIINWPLSSSYADKCWYNWIKQD